MKSNTLTALKQSIVKLEKVILKEFVKKQEEVCEHCGAVLKDWYSCGSSYKMKEDLDFLKSPLPKDLE